MSNRWNRWWTKPENDGPLPPEQRQARPTPECENAPPAAAASQTVSTGADPQPVPGSPPVETSNSPASGREPPVPNPAGLLPRDGSDPPPSAHEDAGAEVPSQPPPWGSPGTIADLPAIDGCFPAILNVRDLASHQQLLWLPIEHETAQTVIGALDGLFVTHGAPLVIKCDIGPAFRAEATKGLLRGWSIFGLYSPPYCAWYNGGCERAKRTLKELTAHLAERAGRAGFWTSDDLLAARLTANRQTRPWGTTGPTPEEVWTDRRELVLDERAELWLSPEERKNYGRGTDLRVVE